MGKVKAKGGLRYEIKTSDGKLHAGVAPRDIHFSAPGAKNNLDEMLQVLDTEAPALVDPEVLEICYEVAAEEEKELGTKQIAGLLDFGSSPVDIYRTFRALVRARQGLLPESERPHVALQRARQEDGGGRQALALRPARRRVRRVLPRLAAAVV